MSKTFKIRKGLNIRVKGHSQNLIAGEIKSIVYAVRPDDFAGITPKINFKEGDTVKRGDILLFDKHNQMIKLASPIAGVLKTIVRGEKRKILEVLIEAGNDDFVTHNLEQTTLTDREKLLKLLSDSGLISFVKQRPYGVVANPEIVPRDIFISFFDSAPLAPDYDFMLGELSAEINKAISALSVITDGKVYCSLKPGSKLKDFIPVLNNVEINYFDGPHPAGLVGTHINKIKPINKGEIVWTIDAADLPIFGHLLINGDYKIERLISVCGSAVKSPVFYKVTAGADLSSLNSAYNLKNDIRIISGNVLTGTDISKSPYLGLKDKMISVIPEGNKFEMFGWALPGVKKFSNSGSFLSGLLPVGEFEIDTNFHGGLRSYVVTGEYEKVCPLDIFPQLLIKAILVSDIDKMEQLGIYEVIEEDFALCEFVCTSKIDVQDVLHSGIEMMRKEMA